VHTRIFHGLVKVRHAPWDGDHTIDSLVFS